MRSTSKTMAMVAATLLLAAGGHLALTQAAPDAPRRIEVTAKRFTFEPAEITVKKGESVDLVLHSEDVTHGIKFKELDLQTEIPKGSESELKFTPDKAGDFIGHCSHFCGIGHGSMTLTLHVTE